jgi:hypothetical protein
MNASSQLDILPVLRSGQDFFGWAQEPVRMFSGEKNRSLASTGERKTNIKNGG